VRRRRGERALRFSYDLLRNQTSHHDRTPLGLPISAEQRCHSSSIRVDIRGGEFSLKIETAASGRSNIEYETGGAAGALCERHVGNFNSTLRPYGEGKMEMLSVDVTWRVALLSAIFAADLLMFISLCREELRDWRVSRYYPVPVAKALSAPLSNPR